MVKDFEFFLNNEINNLSFSQVTKKTIEEVFDIEITNHSLYFYGNRKKED